MHSPDFSETLVRMMCSTLHKHSPALKLHKTYTIFFRPSSSMPWSFQHCAGLLLIQYLKLFEKVHRKTFKCFQAFLLASVCWEFVDENVKHKPQRESGTNCSFRMQMFTQRCRVLAGVARQDMVEGSTQGWERL